MGVGNGLPVPDATHNLILGYLTLGDHKSDLIKSVNTSKNGFQSLGVILPRKYITGKGVLLTLNL